MDNELIDEVTICPICGNQTNKINVGRPNLKFLQQRLQDRVLDEAITLASVAWTSFPALRVSADSKSVANNLLKGIEDQISNALKPFEMMRATIYPLVEKLTNLIGDLPEDLQGEFKNIKSELNEKLQSINETAANSSKPLQSEIRELELTINTLISKPTSIGTLNEETLKLSWNEFFVKDNAYRKGNAGKPDLVVIPFVERNGLQVGQKIVVERKAGLRQKYCGIHLQETINHTRAEGSRYGMLVYDAPSNLVDSQKPFFLTMVDCIVIAVCDVSSGSWRIGREIFEVLQSTLPSDNTFSNEQLLMQKTQLIIDEMVSINQQIETLRRFNNSTISNCDKVRNAINQLEQSITACQQKLRNVLTQQNTTFNILEGAEAKENS